MQPFPPHRHQPQPSSTRPNRACIATICTASPCAALAITAEDPEREHDEMNAAMVASGAGDLNHNPQHACERSELLAQIDEALVKLPSGVAEVFMAREVEGESTASVAARSGLSEANIWVRVHRARKALQTHLAACGAAEHYAVQAFRWAA